MIIVRKDVPCWHIGKSSIIVLRKVYPASHATSHLSFVFSWSDAVFSMSNWQAEDELFKEDFLFLDFLVPEDAEGEGGGGQAVR